MESCFVVFTGTASATSLHCTRAMIVLFHLQGMFCSKNIPRCLVCVCLRVCKHTAIVCGIQLRSLFVCGIQLRSLSLLSTLPFLRVCWLPRQYQELPVPDCSQSSLAPILLLVQPLQASSDHRVHGQVSLCGVFSLFLRVGEVCVVRSPICQVAIFAKR